jgi:crotonobetainyl-CoA:carnitine CoA-transferase CaiB-like acyl-CoA transferase
MLPLAGLTVLDFSTLLPGPLATLFLAEAGAEVIKVERPGGEDMRRFPPPLGDGSAPFAALNAGKKSIVADLKTQEGRAALHPLLGRADILVEQFRPGVMDRLGLGYGDVRTINPKVVYCSISGYGQTGPRAGEAGHDINYQAVAGLLSLSPGTLHAPTVPPALTADIGGGAMPAVINILLALRRRDLTGEGCHLDIAMADAAFTFAWQGLAEGFATGRFPGSQETMLTGGSPRYGLYATADGRFLAVGALEPKFWEAFCEGIGLDPALRNDASTGGNPRGDRRQDRGPHRCRVERRPCAARLLRHGGRFFGRGHGRRAFPRARAVSGAGGRREWVERTDGQLPLAEALRRPLDELRSVPELRTPSPGEEIA